MTPKHDQSTRSHTDYASKLSKYSALTVGGIVGSMAAFEASEAAMVFTNADMMLSDHLVDVPTVDINLNANGPASMIDNVADVKITVLTASLLSAQGIGDGWLAGTVGPGPGSFFYPTAFENGDKIGSTVTWGANATQATTVNTFGTLANGTLYGNWAGNSMADYYLGVKFLINGEDHYGWVHVMWDPSTDTMQVDRYAYNDEVGAPAVVPEPSALTLLALGALGLAQRRRREDNAR